MFVDIFLTIEVAFSKVIDLFCTLEEKGEIYCAKDGRMLYHSTKLEATIETAVVAILASTSKNASAAEGVARANKKGRER